MILSEKISWHILASKLSCKGGLKRQRGVFSSSMICTGEIEVGTPGQKIKAVEGDSPLMSIGCCLVFSFLVPIRMVQPFNLKFFFEAPTSNKRWTGRTLPSFLNQISTCWYYFFHDSQGNSTEIHKTDRGTGNMLSHQSG